MRDAFNLFDTDKDGKIKVDEMRKVLKQIDLHLDDQELNALISKLDENGDGTINFDGKCIFFK